MTTGRTNHIVRLCSLFAGAPRSPTYERHHLLNPIPPVNQQSVTAVRAIIDGKLCDVA
jgi:hypothetical protein